MAGSQLGGEALPKQEASPTRCQDHLPGESQVTAQGVLPPTPRINNDTY